MVLWAAVDTFLPFDYSSMNDKDYCKGYMGSCCNMDSYKSMDLLDNPSLGNSLDYCFEEYWAYY